MKIIIKGNVWEGFKTSLVELIAEVLTKEHYTFEIFPKEEIKADDDVVFTINSDSKKE